MAAFLVIALPKTPATAQDAKSGKHPPVAVTFFIQQIDSADEREALRAALQKIKSVTAATFGSHGEYVTVQFDSHVVSYHQIAQAIADAGTAARKKYDPQLKIEIPEYATADHAAKIDVLFSGKRLNQRVRIEPLDKAKGEFAVHFLSLELDPNTTGPQGFNGGHLHHPIHDPPPRGLGLEMNYLSGQDSMTTNTAHSEHSSN
ncbi:MAG TPA: hypothetical protein VFE46_03655 [Pirellulales bacterium]|nr:hypothetical protein [Pirellulales bacterium]